MGTIRNGANGGFSGKAGSIIGSSWNDVNYIKGLPKLSKKPASLKQLDQRARFTAALRYLGPIKDVLMMGWKGQTTGRTTGFNMGIQHALGYALIGTYPDYTIDKSLIQVSKGTLQKYSGDAMNFIDDEGLKLQLSWSPQVNKVNAFADDSLNVLLYNEEQDLFLFFDNAALRSEATASLQLPGNFVGQTVHVYLFYTNNGGTRQSNSVYQGPIVVVP